MPRSLARGCCVERGGDLLQGEDVAPGRFEGVDGGAAALHHVLHAGAEDAVDADDDFVARLDEIGGDALHARHARAADGEGERVLRAEDLAQQLAGLVHDGDILRVEVAEGRGGQGAQDALGNWAGAGAKEDAFGGIQLGNGRLSHKHAGGYRWRRGKARRFGRALLPAMNHPVRAGVGPLPLASQAGH